VDTPHSEQALPELTLEEAIQIAFSHHGDVSSARQSAAGAQARITAARSGLYPQVNVTVSSDLSRTTTATGSGVGGVSSSTSYTTSTQTNFGLSQNLFDGGRTRAQVRQAQANAGIAGAGIGAARQNLAFTVASNFYEQLRQERLVVQRSQQVELAQGQLAQIEAQIEAGTAARVDAQSVRVTLSQARFDLTSARNSLEIAKTNLRDVLGLERGPALRLRESDDVAALSASFGPLPAEQATTVLAAPDASTPAANADATDDIRTHETASETTPVPAATPVPLRVPALASLNEYLEEAQRSRPDLMQSRANVQSGEASVSIAKAERLPQVGLTAGYNLRNLTNSGRGPTAGLSLSLPLFDAGGRKADVKAAQADLAASRTRLTQLEKDVAADVEASYIRVEGAVERISNAQDLMEAARENLEAATAKYQAGVGIVLDVVNAQTQFAEAQTSATTAIYDYQIALADLSRAAGQFADDTTPQSFPTSPTSTAQ
jgi:outer membrane protein TolC